jgi:hypothetical protein
MSEPHGVDGDGDPTADFLAEVLPGETPWRTDRPAAPSPDRVANLVDAEPGDGKWSRARAAGRVAGKAAPYLQAAVVAGLVIEAIGAFDGGSGLNS